jgi:hypothetical protein
MVKSRSEWPLRGHCSCRSILLLVSRHPLGCA